MAALAAAALSTPNAAVILAGTRALHGLAGAPGTRDRPTPCEQLLCADLVGSGDSLIMFSDGVTEARSDYGTARDLYGDERLGRLVARLGDMTAVAIADAIQLAALTFSGGRLRDDTVALVMKVPA